MKIFKRILLAIVLLFSITFAAAYYYKDALLKELIAQYNEKFNITISYDTVDLGVFKSFPKANLTVNDLVVINDDLNDTLFSAKKTYLALNIKALFKKNIEKITIDDLLIDTAKLNLIITENGLASYDIKEVNPTNTVDSNTSDKETTINLKKYKLQNSTIVFNDAQSNMLLMLKGINHTGNGDFTASKLDLETKTTVDTLDFQYEGVNYFNKAKIDLDAVLGIDLDEMKFTFKDNKAKINDLSLVFDGFIDLNDTNQEYDITFGAPKANFKNILSLIPSAYSSDFAGVTANGIASVNGSFKGLLSDETFPDYNLKIKTDQASFKYPELPKSMKNIYLEAVISSANNISLDLKKLQFTIDEDTFQTSGKITKLSTNPTVDASVKGVLNLESLSKAYPVAIDQKLTGVLKADFNTKLTQQAVETNDFKNIKTNGTASLTDFTYSDKENVAQAIQINKAAIKFNTNSIDLEAFDAKTGKSDIKATGKLDNLYAFLFDNKDLKGDFVVQSNNFVVSDFLVEDSSPTAESETDSSNLKIPDFLDIKTKIKAKRVVYDNIILDNVSGVLKLKNQKASLINTKAQLFDGDIVLNGDIDTKTTPANFDLDMDIKKFDIANSFKTVETLQKLAPIAKALQGKYNSKFNIKGNLNKALSPDLNSLSGELFAKLLVNNLDSTSLPLLNTLSAKLDFIDFSKIDLSDLVTILSFKDGTASVKPFDIKYKDITMHVSGSHGFDQSLKYSLKMDIPAKYLGEEAANLLSKLTNINKDTITVPLSTVINGSILKPTVQVDSKKALKILGNKIIEYQKQELKDKATDAATNAIQDVLNNSGIGDVLGGSKPKDSITNPKDTTINTSIKDSIKNSATNEVKNVLDNLFEGKKKKP